MNPKLQMTLAAVLGGIASGTVVALVDGEQRQIAVVYAAPASVELTGKDASDVLTAATEAGVRDGDDVECSPGVVLDGARRDDLDTCKDGKGAAWHPPTKGGETLTVADGKVYTRAKAVEAKE